jgi:hypothetical protein
MAMTLIEFAKTCQDPLQRGVVKTFAATSPIFEFLPFVEIPGNSWTYNQETTLPGVEFRQLNDAYNESVGVIKAVTEKIKILGGDADSDKMFQVWGGSAVIDRRAYDVEAKARAIARYFDKIFIDGDEGSDAKQFDGLNVRCAASQHLHADAGTGTAGANLTENLMQCLADMVDGGPNLFLMGKKVYRNLANLFKGSSILAFGTPNYFGYMPPMFNGVRIGILDKDNEGNDILPMDETEGSSSGVCGSIYALRMEPWQGVCGLQNTPVQVRDLGEIDTKPVLRTRIEWPMTIMLGGPKCAARLQGITTISGVA